MVFGIIGILIGLSGILVAWLKRPPSYRPCFQTSYLRLIGGALPRDVSVYYKDEEVSRLSSVHVAFWNHGRKALKKTDVVRPITIAFDDGGRIVKHSVLRSNKEENEVNIHTVGNTALKITFEYLDYKDGCIVEILHESGLRRPNLEGTIIENQRGILDLDEADFYQLPKTKWYVYLVVPTLLIAILSLAIFSDEPPSWISSFVALGVAVMMTTTGPSLWSNRPWRPKLPKSLRIPRSSDETNA